MVVITELPGTWRCSCGKWNAHHLNECWSCHEPKVAAEKPKHKKRHE